MKNHNKRFPKMWNIISQEIDFTNKTVIDAGCGYGDFAYAVAQQARLVTAYEINPEIYQFISKQYNQQDNLIIYNYNINGFQNVNKKTKFDYLCCFSVLPYLENPTKILQSFRQLAKTILIECQYFEDGPGFEYIANDNDMKNWLKLCGYNEVKNIGKTFVEGRNKWRTIWRCK